MEDILRIRFLSEWHCGSGLGESHLADAVLNRDAEGIPFITGRAVKGALREGAWRLSKISGREDLGMDLVKELWGGPSEGNEASPGRIFVSSAALPSDVREWLLGMDADMRAESVQLLLTRRAQTSIENGSVKKGSLRTMECGMPGLEFEAKVFIDAPGTAEAWIRHYLAAVCSAVKSMGANRARGLGLCRLTLAGMQGRNISLPERRPS